MEQFFFDYYYKERELADWEKKLKEFTDQNFRGVRLWAQIYRELRAARRGRWTRCLARRRCSWTSARRCITARRARRDPSTYRSTSSWCAA